jgi:hypothetical protein
MVATIGRHCLSGGLLILADADDTTSTAIVTGIDLGGPPLWIVGQAWFQGSQSWR